MVFFRYGRYVLYDDELNVEKLSNWIENTQERFTRELDDSNFEHDTQASTGATTGDWFVML